jgi:DNA-binding Lrp family transcriptional regulator
VGARLGVDADRVLEQLARFQHEGAISRVGAVFAPGAIGASTLAALEVPAERLDDVAAMVSAFPEVNHNYEREHRVNLWFVAAAESDARLTRVLTDIEKRAHCGAVLALRLVEEFRIDLGFDMRGDAAARRAAGLRPSRTAGPLSQRERRLLAALQGGLPLVSHPYAALGEAAGYSGAEVLEQIRRWVEAGVIRRLGVVVRHRELGYAANAMVVWDVPDDRAHLLGRKLAQQEAVTLCYRRARALPRWPYNLYCMVHGRSRDAVLETIERIGAQAGLLGYPTQVLFSRTRYKQTGARYLGPPEVAHG